MPEIKCPWMMCVHNSSEERCRSGQCEFTGEVELDIANVREFIKNPPGELIDAELIECKNYEKSLEKQNKFKEE